jgi:hypothetical protein
MKPVQRLFAGIMMPSSMVWARTGDDANARKARRAVVGMRPRRGRSRGTTGRAEGMQFS